MSEWELKDGEQEFNIPSEPVNPMTPERFKQLREEADKKMLDMYNSMMVTGSRMSQLLSASKKA